MSNRSLPFLLVLALCFGALLASCDGCGGVSDLPDSGHVDASTDTDAGPDPTGRCDVSLERFLDGTGSGSSSIKQISATSELLTGPTAWGKVGDYRLANDKVQIVIQGFDRHIGPQPYGGTILDADLIRSGQPSNDQFGEIGLLYNFGRTVDPEKFEILHDGTDGRAVVLAVTGHDAPNDYLSIRNQLRNQLGNVPKADPYVAVPLLITNYFILAPGEQRLRFVTALCNEGEATLPLALGDLTDPGETLEFFNGNSCTLGFGYGGVCFGLDRMSWYGYQGDGVAYGYAPYNPNAPAQPSSVNALLTVSGVTGSVLGANGITGIASWFQDGGTPEGEVRLSGGDMRYFVRDFIVAKDLGQIATIVEQTRAEITGARIGRVSGTVSSSGTPIANARVTFSTTSGHSAVFITDSAGQYSGSLTARAYTAIAWASGRLPSAQQNVTLSEASPSTVNFDLSATRTLTVNVAAATGGALPAKVTVLCQSGTCTAPHYTLNIFTDTIKDPLLESMQLVGYVGASGTATFQLPPGQYEVIVTRGPEYSIFPNTFPTTSGFAVDLRTGNGTVNATLHRVIDTTGFQSADFHVHAVNSPDAPVSNEDRVQSFMGDGIDVIVSTDHDYVTDFAPYITKVGGDPFIASVIGEEVSTMDFGHYNLFPLIRDDDPINGGAVDWAGERGPTLNPKEIFAAGRAKGARTVHFNHPRGFLGGFTHLKVDTDTLATHADPRDFRMAVPPGSNVAVNSLLLNSDFNAIELLNSADDEFDADKVKPLANDWFTLLSRGIRVAATGVSDTHRKYVASGWRTWVNTGVDTPAQFDALVMSNALNALKASASNGPFVKISARRVDSGGTPTTAAVGMGETVPLSNDDVEVTLDIQVPEYLDVTRIELFMHQPQDDDRCPRNLASPNAATTRVACNGELNTNWPSSGIFRSLDFTLSGAELEVVNTIDGVTYRRWHTVKTFRIPRPPTDNWIVAFVYGTKPLFPLNYRPVAPSKPNTPVLPFALTNPIFVDADGNGYNNYPFNPPPPPGAAPPPPEPPVYGPVTSESLRKAWEVIGHGH